MKDLIFYGNPYYKGIIIIYRMTLRCNYKCDYCDSFDNQTNFSDKETINKTIDFIKSIPGDTPIELHVTGGEPTLHPEFLYFIEQISNIFKNRKDSELLILSNLSNTIDFYKKTIEILNNVNSRLFFSFHKNNTTDEIFMSKVDKLYEFKKEVEVGFMIESEDCIEKYKKYTRPYPINFRPLFNLLNKPEYSQGLETDSELSVLTENNTYIKEHKYKKQGNFLGWICLVYSKNLFIEHNGDIQPCTSIQNKKFNVKTTNYMDIITKHKMLVCTSKICHCEHKVPKFNLRNQNLLVNKDICENVFGFVPDWIIHK